MWCACHSTVCRMSLCLEYTFRTVKGRTADISKRFYFFSMGCAEPLFFFLKDVCKAGPFALFFS